jgi:hypothetical protein
MEHTADNPYCGDLACWCHQNSNYHATFTTGRELEWDEVEPQNIILAIEILGDHSYMPVYPQQA